MIAVVLVELLIPDKFKISSTTTRKVIFSDHLVRLSQDGRNEILPAHCVFHTIIFVWNQNDYGKIHPVHDLCVLAHTCSDHEHPLLFCVLIISVVERLLQ